MCQLSLPSMIDPPVSSSHISFVNYELYHDESKEGGYWHGMLLVPVHKKGVLLSYLEASRRNYRYSAPLSLKKVSQKGKIYYCIESWISIGVAALASRIGRERIGIYVGKRVRGTRDYETLREPIRCKFVLLRECDNLARMSPFLDYGGKVETTFRMGLKGGLHYLGNDNEPIYITKMHFDGFKHQRRHLDRHRIVGRLSGLRRYCRIAPDPDIIDDRTSDHTRPECQSYDDCQLLQLTDVMTGCFRSALGVRTNPIHAELEEPIRSLVSRYKQGYRRMQNSRWRNAFCISQCFLDPGGGWVFETCDFATLPSPQVALL